MSWTDGKTTPSLQCPPSSESRAGYECVKSRERRKGLIYRTERPGFFWVCPLNYLSFPFQHNRKKKNVPPSSISIR